MYPIGLIRLYEKGYPLVSVILFSQLFAEQADKNMLAWMLSAPIRTWKYLLEKWSIAFTLVFLFYLVPLFIIDRMVVHLPWKDLLVYVFVPSVFLGHLAMFVTIVSKESFAGLAVPLFVWGMEMMSYSQLAGNFRLFAMIPPVEILEVNRAFYWALAILFLLLSGVFLRRRSYFL